MIDLHVHSTASDGTCSPAELVARAAANGVRTFALTDHDCCDGLSEAISAAKKHNITVIPGIEVSLDYDQGTFHMLGYFINYADPVFQTRINSLKHARSQRNPQIIAKLNNAGVKISLADAVAESGGGQLGRVHIARALVKRGWVATVPEAFDKYLAKGKLAYCKKAFLSAQEAISMIISAGGAAVVAHPFTLGLADTELDNYIKELKSFGLAGLEVYYPLHSSDKIKIYSALADKYCLVKTGGTDFHGANKQGVELGKGLREIGFMNDAVQELFKKISIS